MLHLGDTIPAALKRWADSEDRTMSAQARIVLADAIPAPYFEPDDEEQSR